MSRLRRLEQLEQKAPYAVCRPAGVHGGPFIAYVCQHIDTATQTGLDDPDVQKLVSAWMDLFTDEESEILSELGETMVAAGFCDETYNPIADHPV